MYIKIFSEVFIFGNFIHYTYAILDSYIYEHPTQSDQKCYMCPPGYRVNGIGDDPKKCSINRCEIATFPDCKVCPDGYYTDEWSVSPRCREQTQCNGVGEEILEYGGTTRRNVCGCRNGFMPSGKICIKFSCPKPPLTTACPEKFPSHAPSAGPTLKPVSHPLVATTKTTENSINSSAEKCNFTSYSVIIIVETFLLIIVGVLCIYLLKTKHKGGYHSGSSDNFEEDRRLQRLQTAQLIIANKLVRVNEYFLHGLQMVDTTVFRFERSITDPQERIMKLLYEWKENQGKNATAEKLIEALRRVGMNGIADEIEINLARSDSPDGGGAHLAEQHV